MLTDLKTKHFLASMFSLRNLTNIQLPQELGFIYTFLSSMKYFEDLFSYILVAKMSIWQMWI